MAKSLRSKVKRHFRTVRRGNVAQTSTFAEAEKRKEETIQAIIDAPRPDQPAPTSEDGAEPTSMETEAAAGGGPNANLPPLTTKNPGKLARKLKQRRLAASRGVNPGIKKKARPLSGANQFHKKNKKR